MSDLPLFDHLLVLEDYENLFAYLSNPNPKATTPHTVTSRAKATSNTGRRKKTREGWTDVTIGDDWKEYWRCKRLVPVLEMYCIAESLCCKLLYEGETYNTRDLDRSEWLNIFTSPEIGEGGFHDYYCDGVEPFVVNDIDYSLQPRHLQPEVKYRHEKDDRLVLSTGRMISRHLLLTEMWK